MQTTNVATPAALNPTEASWPLERILFLLAGAMTLLSAVLGAFASPWFLLIAGFVAINQLAFAAVGNCVASLVLERAFGVKRSGSR